MPDALAGQKGPKDIRRGENYFLPADTGDLKGEVPRRKTQEEKGERDE